MRGFVATVLLLSFGVFGILEVARRPPRAVEPAPRFVDSGDVEWREPSVFFSHGQTRTFGDLDPKLETSELLSAMQKQLDDARFWAKEIHKRCRAHFDAVPCRASVSRVGKNTVTVLLGSTLPVDEQWDFLVRWGPVQYHCRVRERRADRIEGTIRFAIPGPASTTDEGVLLLRPVHLQPKIAANAGSADAKIDALAHALGRMRTAREWADLGYGAGSGKFIGLGPGREGRVVASQNAGGKLLVTVALGQIHGVAVGDEYKLSRGSDFVGFVKIVKISHLQCEGEFDLQFPGKGAPPRVGDRAYTR
ncbi:MAG: hypothetical protein ACYTGZ_00845 [Planctomycetota bacterium]